MQNSKFISVPPENVSDNVFKLIGKDWMLITAGDIRTYNMMTASWGGMGVIWNKQIVICYIRPQRFTYDFVEKNEYFTLSFFNEAYRGVLNHLGTSSGRNVNKMQTAGLTALKSGNNSVYFSEARLVFECRKIYYDDITPLHFLDNSIDKLYPYQDYHRMYFGEITLCMIKG